MDVYGIDSNGDKKLLGKFRKNMIPLDICQTALENLKKAAMRKNDNRGAAGGVLDAKKLPKYVKGLANAGKFRTVGYYNADGRFIINRNSDKIKEIGGIVFTKYVYPLYSNPITDSNKTLYFHAKDHYANTKEHILIKYNKR